MSYSLIFQATDTIAVGSSLLSGATSTTLTSGNFASPTGTQLYVVDYDIPGTAEIISATVVGTAMTSIVRGLTGGAVGTTNHSAGAKIGSLFVPQHYDRVANRTLGYAQAVADQTGISTITDLTSLSVAVTVPTGGARIRITGFALSFSDLDAKTIELSIREGSTTLAIADYQSHITAGSPNQTIVGQYSAVATAGSHTYKLSISATGGTTGIHASATAPSFILVENIE